MGEKVHYTTVAIIAGHDPAKLPDQAVEHGAENVIMIRGRNLASYSTDLYTRAISDQIGSRKPDIMLVGATYQGRELAARIAARLRTGLTANAVSLDIDTQGSLVSGVPGYGSKVVAQVACIKNKPQMSTVRPGVFSKQEFPGTNGKIEIVDSDIPDSLDRVRTVSRDVRKTSDIGKAGTVVIGGIGVENSFPMVKEFARKAGAEVGVSRPIADKGLAPRDSQIGSTGYSLKAKVAVVIGVSGAEHFVTGIAGCKTVISVNTDKNAKIFDYSDYCVVADASRILQLLNRGGSK